MNLTGELLEYVRLERFPTVWCPGCGNGTIFRAFLEAVHSLGIDKNEVAVVSGIGCSSRITGYMDFNTMHTLHGRAIAFATGVKLARPEFRVIVMGGDGDLLAIGGNHFIHACRRNIDMTVLVFNNGVYGMTGGQHSPTSPMKMKSTTAPYGNLDKPFDVVKLAISAGATYVARVTTYHYDLMVRYLKNAMEHKGFSVVDIFTQCPTYYGRYTGMRGGSGMLDFFKRNSIPLSKAVKMREDELKEKIVIGEFVKMDKKEYTELYSELKSKLTKEKLEVEVNLRGGV